MFTQSPANPVKNPSGSSADKAFNSFLVISFIISILLPVIYYIVSTYSLSTGPRSMHSSVKNAFDSLFLLPGIIGIGSVAIAPVFLISAIISLLKKKTDWLKLFLSAIAWIFCLVLFLNLSGAVRKLRHKAFVELAMRSEKVITAINKYRTENGEYPEKMQSIIPLYLPDQPYTGLPLYPDYEYEVSTGEELNPIKSYELRVKCPSGGINWDVFFYWPERNYPDDIYGGYVERIGDWAYVHE